jgi:hypothetical protein
MPMRARLFLGPTLALCAALGGCASLLGVSDFEAVDDAAVGSDAAPGTLEDGAPLPPDGSVSDANDATTEPLPIVGGPCGTLEPCGSGHRIAVTLIGVADAGEAGLYLLSEPAGITVYPGELASACFPSDRLELYVYGGPVEFAGVVCEDGPTTDERCRFDVREPLCIVATPR